MSDKLLPYVRLDASAIPKEHHFDVWSESCTPLFQSEPLTRDWKFPTDSHIYMVGELMFTRVNFSATRFSRKKRHRLHGDGDSILIQFNKRGRQHGLVRGKESYKLAPDRITLQDFAHDYASVSEQSETYGIAIPRHLIELNDQIFHQCPAFSWSIQSPRGKLLLHKLMSIWQELPGAKNKEGEAIARDFLDLVNGILATEKDLTHQAHIDNALLLTIKDYISANLSNPTLNTDTLCKNFYCSRAKIYRLFSNEGGVQRYIQQQRLIRCYQELLQLSTPLRGVVSQIAEQWGFYDTAHFSKSFKQTYGINPTDIFPGHNEWPITHPKPQPTSNPQECYWREPQLFHDWLEKF